MSTYTLTQKEFSLWKRRLTVAKKKGPRAVIVTCTAALARFEDVGFPDSWNNWQRAKEDAVLELQRTQSKGRLSF